MSDEIDWTALAEDLELLLTSWDSPDNHRIAGQLAAISLVEIAEYGDNVDLLAAMERAQQRWPSLQMACHAIFMTRWALQLARTCGGPDFDTAIRQLRTDTIAEAERGEA